jgi:hypothetical protein
MTWKEFKEFVENYGVTDDMRISYIDVTGGNRELDIDIDDKSFYVEN